MREFLREHAVEFETVDINYITQPLATAREITGDRVATPTVVINGEACVGFDPTWMAERLGLDER